MSSRLQIRSHVTAAELPRRVISLQFFAEWSIILYFGLSFFYYLKPIPYGHISNLAFLTIFSLLAAQNPSRRAADRSVLIKLGLVGGIFICSFLCWILRDGWALSDLLRSVTWLTPAALLLAIYRRSEIRHILVCQLVAVMNLVMNLLTTFVFADFNRSIAKFEVNVTWLGISSNELSFHLIVFCCLFFILGRLNGLASLTGFASLIHLSKAHLVGVVVSLATGLLRRRLALIMLFLSGIGLGLWAVANTDVVDQMDIPPAVKRVFVPILDATDLAARVVVKGDLVETGLVSGAVGLYRFEVYQSALDLLRLSSIGYPQSIIEMELRGLDPHSNIFYLGLREGLAVLSLYFASMIFFLRRIRTFDVWTRLALAALVYALFRSMFLTFDPVKLMALALYAETVLSMDPRAKVTQND